jgi:RNA polymerase sigma-70 factor (ECF subfamily)
MSAGLHAVFAEERAALRRFLVARTGSADEADDVLQELWLRVGGAAPGPIGNPRSYLFRMAQNIVLDRLREARRRGERERDWADVTLDQRAGAADPIDRTAEEAAIAAEETARLAAAIDALPPGAARAFRLHKIDGLSHSDTAARLGISRKGVEKHIATAMLHLRRALREGELG